MTLVLELIAFWFSHKLDDIEIGAGRQIPLWFFGFLY